MSHSNVQSFEISGHDPLYMEEQYAPEDVRFHDERLILGLRVADKHCNSGGRLHGSMICAMADLAIGHNVGLVMGQQKLGDSINSIRGMPQAPQYITS